MGIKPTIGRIVWYHPIAKDTGGQPNAAVVAYVHSDTIINLTFFDSDGLPYSSRSVRLWDGAGDTPPRPYAEWMPYQIGQAAKTEAAEAAKTGTAADEIASFIATRAGAGAPSLAPLETVTAPMPIFSSPASPGITSPGAVVAARAPDEQASVTAAPAPAPPS